MKKKVMFECYIRQFVLSLLTMISSISYAYDFEVDGIFYNIIASDQVEVTYNIYRHPYGSYSWNTQIPESVLYNNVEYRVTSIGEEAFTLSTLSENFTIPNSIKTIGQRAFFEVKGLKKITLSDALTTIGDYAFSQCSELESLLIPNSVTSIGEHAFEYCHLGQMTLPNNLETISRYIFYNSHLTSIIIPSSVKKINEHAFDNCDFTTVSIPEGVTTISEGAFQRCKKLSSVTIPSTVTSIGDYAFDTSSGRSLELVTSNILSPFPIPEKVFYNAKYAAVLQVPKGTKSSYQNYSGWAKYFSEIVEMITYYTCSIKSSGNGSVTCNSDVIRDASKNFSLEEGSSVSLSFAPDNGYQIKSVKVNNTDITSSVINNIYTISNISSDTAIDVEFEAIPPTTYTLSIKATGNGSASYDGQSIRGKTQTFTVNEGTKATITFTPDNGYRIKSLKVNGSSKTASTSYAVTVNADTSIEVEFEAIPATTYTLSIKATGNGSASYDGQSIRGKTQTFTVNEGTKATITFTPDNGYRIKSLKVNGSSKTASTSYDVTVNADTSIEVEFEAIPATTYTLSIKATGNGSASYDGKSIRGKTQTFTVNEGTKATIIFTPDNGYRIKSLKVNGSSKTASTSYDVTVNADTSIEVEFEAIPATTYTLSIKATGNGSASYDGQSIRGKTQTFTVNEGTKATITFTPDNGYRIKSLKVNGSSKTASTSYAVTVNADTSIEVEFEAIPATTYTLSIKATGNGSASYDGKSIRGKTQTFTVNEGTKATITFTPDNGYRIKSLKVNGSSKTASTSYDFTINADTSIEVEFEAIPPTTYTLSIKATGNGSASYDGKSIRGKTQTFTLNEGTKATITFTPDNGYRIKSLKVNGSSKTASTSYDVTVNADTSVEVEFEAIPPTTYTLSIKATGNGSASYDGKSIRGKTQTFTVNEGTKATITFTPDNGYRIKSLKVNGSSKTASTSYDVTVNADTSVEVEFEAIPATTYTLSIKATGNGSASYDGKSIRGKTQTFTVNEGTKATITFTPDNGYRIKSLKVNGSSKTASTSYDVTVNADTSVEVEFEVIPDDPTPTPTPTTYTLSIKATGNGSASYDGQSIRGKTQTFTVNEGTKATITFTPDNGYRIKSLKVNGSSKTASTSYDVTVNADTSVEVEFEEIPEDPTPTPTPTTYTLIIEAIGNGTVSYGGENVRQTTENYSLDKDAYVTLTFIPDDGYQIKDVEVNGTSVSLGNNSYELRMNGDVTVNVEFEEIPTTTFSLSISVTGNGSVNYNGDSIRETTLTYTVNEGSKIELTFIPDEENWLKSVMANGSVIEVSNDTYIINDINSDINVEVVFEQTVHYDVVTIEGINYQVISYDDHALMLDGGDYGLELEVPETVNYQGEEWKVIGVTSDALLSSEEIAAVIWNPEVLFSARVKNPNLLLYVKDEAYAPAAIKNVVVNGHAKSITLTDAQSGNNFYCPESFIAESVVYSHSYSMKTGMNESRGWETIALPFDVQEFSHSSRGIIVPFAKWTEGSDMKPFWLYELSGDGFVEAEEIKANTPYVISMPNNELYENEYKLSGRVTFTSHNVTINKTDDITTQSFGEKTFIPNFTEKDANAGYYALNVNNDYVYNEGGGNEGSRFILNLRKIHPFEAYMTSASNARSFEVFDGMKTAIRGIKEITITQQKVKVYDLSGKLLKVGTSLDAIKQDLPAGVYIVNNQKIMVK